MSDLAAGLAFAQLLVNLGAAIVRALAADPDALDKPLSELLPPTLKTSTAKAAADLRAAERFATLADSATFAGGDQ